MSGDFQGTVLGKETQYPTEYNANLLHPIFRSLGRDILGCTEKPPFIGVDYWTSYELSWLNPAGKPQVAVAEFQIPYNSTQIIESKSFKLYLNSFIQTKMNHAKELQDILAKDLSAAAGAAVQIKILPLDNAIKQSLMPLPGKDLDDLAVAITTYQPQPAYLTTTTEIVDETLHSNLFKSNCPVTNQPDWASVIIRYEGKKINHEGLLRYIVSYRQHQAFHENCAEQIFCDILRRCAPEKLTVYMRFTRRGGLDINPFRSNFETAPESLRLVRQ